MTAVMLSERGAEVVIVESDRAVIEELSDQLDCSFLHGDGADPAILREAGPQETDVLFCLSDDDHVNIIAGLVGQSLGFRRVIVSVSNPEYEGICEELGLDDTIDPARTFSRYLVDLAHGLNAFELSTAIRAEARLFSFEAGPNDAGPAAQLDLPKKSKVICCYRNEEFILTDDDTRIKKGDHVVVLAHGDKLPELRKRWHPHLGVGTNAREDEQGAAPHGG
jgi:trk system potassium uptake protein TrkA